MSEQDVDDLVVSTALPCCFTPLLPHADLPPSYHLTSGPQRTDLTVNIQATYDSSELNVSPASSQTTSQSAYSTHGTEDSSVTSQTSFGSTASSEAIHELCVENHCSNICSVNVSFEDFKPLSTKVTHSSCKEQVLNKYNLVEEDLGTNSQTVVTECNVDEKSSRNLYTDPEKDFNNESPENLSAESNFDFVDCKPLSRSSKDFNQYNVPAINNNVFANNVHVSNELISPVGQSLTVRIINLNTFADTSDFTEDKQTENKYETNSDESVSSDETLLNCESLSEGESIDNFTQKTPETSAAKETNKFDMGNKSGKSGKHSDDDTADDGGTKCCEIPKKKVKERAGRPNRSSRSDDLAFDSNEVYPFEGRARSEQELVEPVELEPFEIVETDYFKFVPGAGTSEIIKSAAEARSTPIAPIPEESTVTEETTASNSSARKETDVKIPFYVNKGSRLPEAGTSTAHSTFEFKQVKPKYRKAPVELSQHTYENVEMTTPSGRDKQVPIKEPKPSSSSSQSSSGTNSQEVSRKNSKDIIQKPSRKGKSKAQVSTVAETPPADETQIKTAIEVNRAQPKKQNDIERTPSVRDSEIDRNINSVLMLTQTMFSQSKATSESKAAIPNKEIDETAPVIQYENVGVCAKLEPTGISIGHKSVTVATPKVSQSPASTQLSQVGAQVSPQIAATQKPGPSKQPSEAKVKPSTSKESKGKQPSRVEPNREEIAAKQATLKERKEARKELSYDIIEISDTGTLIIKSLADLPSARPCENGNCAEEECEEKEEFRTEEQTEVKIPFETNENEVTKEMNDMCPEIKLIKDNDTVSDIEYKQESAGKEHVPPPTPQGMLILQEEEEEEEEDDFDEDDNENDMDAGEDDRRKSEIIEFSENVCKRLSQLLENNPEEYHTYENDEDDDEVNGDFEKETHDYDTCAYSNHIYETIDGSGRIVVSRQSKRDEYKEFHSEPDDVSCLDCSLVPQARSESSSTLKRTSGDSETYQERESEMCLIQETRKRSESSDDDFPEFFDPRDIPPPQVDADNFIDDHDFSESAKEIEIINKNEERNISRPKIDKSGQPTRREDKPNELPLKAFETDLLIDTPTTGKTEELQEITPTADAHPNLTPLPELANVAEETTAVQFDTSGRQSVTCTESDLDTSEHRDDLSTDSMLADDEAEETMEILFTKTYTEPVEGAEVFLSCTVVNSAYKDDKKKSDTWLSDEALEYFEANASEVMSTAFIKAKREMKDIQICLQSLRRQMEHFHSDCDDVSLPDLPGPEDSYSPDYFGIPNRKAITD